MYPAYIDENISRPIAGIVFTSTLIAVLRPEFSYFVIILFVDFIIRYNKPSYSPFFWVVKHLNSNFLNIDPKLSYSPPKRFAVLIGSIFTGIISLSFILELMILQQIFSIFLLIAAGLQSFFGYCLGCTIYNMLLQLGIINQETKINPKKYMNMKQV